MKNKWKFNKSRDLTEFFLIFYWMAMEISLVYFHTCISFQFAKFGNIFLNNKKVYISLVN